MASRFAVRHRQERYLLRAITSMHSCFFRFGSPRRGRQALHSGGGGGVTVVSRGGEGGVRAKIVVSRGELERIAAGVTRRQCSGAGAGAAPSRRRHIVVTAVSLEGQVARAPPPPPPPRSEPEEGAGGARRGDDWRPALDGIPEES
jgi:hypothetical protein